MQIFVTGFCKIITLEVQPTDLVLDVMGKVEEKLRIPAHLCPGFRLKRLYCLSFKQERFDEDKSLNFYNVTEDSTLALVFGCSTCPSNQTKKDVIQKADASNDVSDNQADASQEFQNELIKSRTVEMEIEVEIKTKTFKKLEEQKVKLDKKITKLENEQSINTTEYEDRKGRSQQKIKIIEQDIEEAKMTLQKCQKDLANKENRRDIETRGQLLDGQQTGSKNNRIKQEIGNLKRKKIDIEKEQSDLPKKQKVNVNEGLVQHISNMIEDKKKDLECPVCFETAETPIYQCTQCHLVCKDCIPSLKICPECCLEYPKSPFRNRYAEKMGEEIKKLSEERKELLDGV